jgi:hypothetical protein
LKLDWFAGCNFQGRKTVGIVHAEIFLKNPKAASDDAAAGLKFRGRQKA